MRPVGRRRTKNLDLPPRMRRVGNAYYYDLGGKPRRWEPLGSDKPKAMLRWAELQNAAAPGRTVGVLIDRFLARAEVRPSTLRSYRMLSKIIRKYWGAAPIATVTHGPIQEYHDRSPNKMQARNVVLLFRAMLGMAARWEWIKTNPADLVQVRPQTRRKRYLTDGEYLAIRERLAPPFLVAMDLADVLALRVSDVVRLKFSDVKDGHISIVQLKTDEPLIVRVTLEVEDVLARAKALPPQLRAHVICSRRGTPYRENTVSRAFREAARAAGIKDARFHDIRAKSASDEQETAKGRLGHLSEASTRGYLRKPVAVTPIKRRIGDGPA